MLENYFDLNIINHDQYHNPNHECGSDYVATTLNLPLGIVALTTDKVVSFDGDGDRIIVLY